MTFFRSLIVLTAGAGLLLAAGCETVKPLPPPRASTTVVLEPKNRSVLATVPPGNGLIVILPAPSEGPGYAWEVVANNVKVLVQTSAVKPLPKPTAERAFTVTFQSVHPGRSIVRFAAIKAGATESEPDDLYEIAVGSKSQ